ncbi:MAG: molybdate ABC transporter substrate-binding protein [Hyphomicrobiaceae bacterium]|nr:MAG: molybdate ABC transporter substrate-binding protein [Hyphomicrobiaceae bacterium]
MRQSRRKPGRLGSALVAVLLVLCGMAKPAPAQGGDVVVFAAASLKNALDAAVGDWQKQMGKKVTVSYAASSALAKQIEQDAPAHMFVSADLAWMDYLAGKNLIRTDTRWNLLGNRMVLIAPKDKARIVDVKPGFDLAKILGDGRLAIANVEAVPAGKYGKAALERLGVWPSVSARLAQAENVRAALLLVSRGEAPAGIVYQTDAAADPNVTIIGVFPQDTHPPIIYPVALTTKGAGPDAMSLLAYLKSPDARRFFESSGFSVLK